MTDILKGSWVGIAGLIYAGVVSMGCTTGGGDSEEIVGEVAALGGGRSPAPPPPSRGFGRGGPPLAIHSHGRPGRHHVEGRPGHGGGQCPGGNGGAGGHSGMGGMGGAPAGQVCVGSPPAGALITGSPTTPAGGTFTYAAPGLSAPVVDSLTSPDGVLQGLHVNANPGVTTDPANNWLGVGLFFSAPACVNATAYTGIKFTITGDLGSCRLSFIGAPSEDNPVANGPFGACTAQSCLSPSFGPILTGTTTVNFTDLSGGDPFPTLDAAAINDIGWQLNAPTDGTACTANFTITDVAFVNGAPPVACTGLPPQSPVITDFSDALVTAPGSMIINAGGTFAYAAPGLTPPALSLVSSDGTPAGQALQVSVDSGTPPADAAFAWDGFGLYFNMCTDASTYAGIGFTINGDLGACSLQFGAQFSQDDDVGADPAFGSCVAGGACFSPFVEPVGAGRTTVRFADMMGGSPLPTVDAARLTAIHWQFTVPTGISAASCAARFTIDDVAFVP